jgi:hypothetical protein
MPITKTNRLRLYKEINAVYTAHINSLCGQNAGVLDYKLAVRVLITRLYSLRDYN